MIEAALPLAIFAVAVLYSSVGHAGASGYIAVMTLLGLAPAEIKPAALALNILVAAISTWQFRRAGHFDWNLLRPFLVLAVPLAFAGGYASLPVRTFQVLVGAVLLWSAGRFVVAPPPERGGTPPRFAVAVATGGFLGLLAGLTGTGGGIFLSPVLMLMGWAGTKATAGASALFILANSTAGLAGHLAAGGALPAASPAWLAAAAAGGAVGSSLGSRSLSPAPIKKLLAVVLAVAGLKLLFS